MGKAKKRKPLTKKAILAIDAAALGGTVAYDAMVTKKDAIIHALVRNVVFALKVLDTKHGGGQMINLKTMTPMGPWQDRFFDSLDLAGYTYDRKAYWASKNKKSKRRRS